MHLPKATRLIECRMDDGAIIRLRQHGNPNGRRLLFSHGNGLAIDGYYPFWRQFLDEYEVLLYDLRNHGQNPLADVEGHSFNSFVNDLDCLLRIICKDLGNKPLVGLFHSLSAIVGLKHTVKHNWPWEALILFDPPLAPPEDHKLHKLARDGGQALSTWAKQRQYNFNTVKELADKFLRANNATPWELGAYELLARSVLTPSRKSDSWELSCPRNYEANIYNQNIEFNFTPLLSQLRCPTFFICADPNHPQARAPAIVNRAVCCAYEHRYQYIPDTTHMLQLEKPHACAAAVQLLLKEIGENQP